MNSASYILYYLLGTVHFTAASVSTRNSLNTLKRQTTTQSIKTRNARGTEKPTSSSKSKFKGYRAPVTWEHFEEVKQSRYFMDRTLFIKEFLRKGNRVLITAPRRSGKSIIMDQVKQFGIIDVHANGSIKTDPRTHKNFALFSEPVPRTNKQLDIFQDRQFFKDHFGKYIMIHMDLNYVDTHSLASIENTLKSQIVRRGFAAHEYLLQSSILNKSEKEVIEYFLYKAPQENPHTASEGIEFMQRYLSKHFNTTKCIMLVDELDSPIKSLILSKGIAEKDINERVNHIRQFLVTALRGNILPIRGILLTGCIRLAGILSKDLNNIDHIPFTANTPLAKFYGVTESQVNALATQENLNETERRNIELWYDGYRTEDTNERFYNVFSIGNYFSKRKFKPYWIDSGSLKIFKSMYLPDILGEKLIACARGKNITINYEVKYEMTHIKDLNLLYQQNYDKNIKPNKHELNLFLQFMYDEGYFTIIERGTNERGHICAAPNYEVRDYLKSLSLEGLRMWNPDSGTPLFMERYFKAISNIDGTDSSFREFLKVSVLLLGDAGAEPENESSFSHVISGMLYFPQYFSREPNPIDLRYVQHDVRVIRIVLDENKKGFTDVLFVVMINGRLVGFVIELKFSRVAVRNPFKKSYEAVNQTLDREYSGAFDSKEIKDAVGEDIEVKVLMGLYCDPVHCSLSYLYDTKNLTETSSIKVKKAAVAEEWKRYKNHFESTCLLPRQ